MTTEQELKGIKAHLDSIYLEMNALHLEMNAINARLQHLSEQPEGNSSELPNSSDPNHYIPKVGELVEVSDDKIRWHEAIFEFYKWGKFHLIGGLAEPDYRNGISKTTIERRYCRRLNGEIIEFGCDKKQPDYSHLLPQGYEFCEEEMAEKWIKVKNPTEANPLGHIWQLNLRPFLSIIGEYRPIRKIQTASYQVDWSDAPDWADVHCWDEDGKGHWYGVAISKQSPSFQPDWTESPFTLPDGLDWKLSKTYRPQ
jgi:hypothetical protein